MTKNPQDLAEFEQIFGDTLDRHDSHKTMLVRGNNRAHVTKELRKAIMLRSRLEDIANKSRRERDLVVKMNKDTKRTYYSKVNPIEAGKEKTFWKKFKPLFSSTCTLTDKIVLVENEVIPTEDKDIADCLKSYFASIVDTISIPSEILQHYERSTDPVVGAINTYASHQSIKIVRYVYGMYNSFEFSKVDSTKIFSEFYRLDKSKKVRGDIPVGMWKIAANRCYREIVHQINNRIQSSTFPYNLKLADLSPSLKARNSAS